MNGDDKKDGERSDLDLWLRIAEPSATFVLEQERPDFILELSDGHRIGLEHTAALHPPDSKHPGPDRSAAARAIRDAIHAKLGKAEEYRRHSGLERMWLLVVIRREEEGLALLDDDERFEMGGFDRIDVLDPFSMTCQRLQSRGSPEER